MRSPNEVSGFSSLRWEDQERIRKKITGASGGKESTDGPAPPAKGKRKIARSDLTVEYAKSNRSTCKGCNSQIGKVNEYFFAGRGGDPLAGIPKCKSSL